MNRIIYILLFFSLLASCICRPPADNHFFVGYKTDSYAANNQLSLRLNPDFKVEKANRKTKLGCWGYYEVLGIHYAETPITDSTIITCNANLPQNAAGQNLNDVGNSHLKIEEDNIQLNYSFTPSEWKLLPDTIDFIVLSKSNKKNTFKNTFRISIK